MTPAVNQIEMHPYFGQRPQRQFHAEHGILTQSWSPLGRGGALLAEPALEEIARAHGVGTGQVVLRWHVQQGVVPIPTSANPERRRGRGRSPPVPVRPAGPRPARAGSSSV